MYTRRVEPRGGYLLRKWSLTGVVSGGRVGPRRVADVVRARRRRRGRRRTAQTVNGRPLTAAAGGARHDDEPNARQNRCPDVIGTGAALDRRSAIYQS